MDIRDFMYNYDYNEDDTSQTSTAPSVSPPAMRKSSSLTTQRIIASQTTVTNKKTSASSKPVSLPTVSPTYHAQSKAQPNVKSGTAATISGFFQNGTNFLLGSISYLKIYFKYRH